MGKFLIEPHGRLQEWVAEEKGYFRDERLDYEFVNAYVAGESGYAAVQSTESAAPEVKRGAFENMERGMEEAKLFPEGHGGTADYSRSVSV